MKPTMKTETFPNGMIFITEKQEMEYSLLFLIFGVKKRNFIKAYALKIPGNMIHLFPM
ncbi:hypothetical protein [Chryseobacterium profundimaris]|uniref:hypothetical protein n=1 Tax=Chryseobacterium profundimaris TaxID=1387275 RepID=UPI0024B7C733|nr:hypothetical protein [Chryseobacterium profundimaris]